MEEEKIERRIQWAYWAFCGIVAAVVWCCKLEFTVSGLKADMEQQKKNRDEGIAQIWNRFGSDHDALTRLQQWHDDKEKQHG